MIATPDAREPILAIDSLTCAFRRFKAVDGLDLDVAPGEAVALWGANGAGKTTVIRCVLGLLPFRGRVEVAGIDVGRRGRLARARMGYVPQELAFDAHLRTDEATAFFARLKRAPRARVPVVLDRVGLGRHVSKRVGALSGGMKQRLALAIALLAEPPLLVLDEMTASLDLSARADFIELLCDLRGAGKTLLFSSHRYDEIEALADRVVVLEAGRSRAVGTPAALASYGGRVPASQHERRVEIEGPATRREVLHVG